VRAVLRRLDLLRRQIARYRKRFLIEARVQFVLGE
jgi:hypothetical protein